MDFAQKSAITDKSILLNLASTNHEIKIRPAGVEPATFWSVARRSIQLSYGRTKLTL